jgi:hypothetical protein
MSPSGLWSNDAESPRTWPDDKHATTTSDAQPPSTQRWPLWHVAPQAPQLLTSLEVSTQALPQRVLTPRVHEGLHVDCSQTSFARHTLPQPPQAVGSVSVVTQRPAHETAPN